MAIDGGMRTKLQAGSTLVARYKGVEHRVTVTERDGKQQFRLADGREFKSPSAAGSAIMGGIACNGWHFWSLESAETATKAQARAARAAAGAAWTAGTGAAPKVRPVCDSCGKHFISASALAHHEAHADRLCTAAA